MVQRERQLQREGRRDPSRRDDLAALGGQRPAQPARRRSTAAGIESDIQNAGGDKPKFGTICDSMINEGVKVLMIVNLDPDSGAACLKKAQAAGIKSIDYDRLTLGGGASYYVSFDNVKVGELMGEGLQKCLTDAGKTKANIVYINGARPTTTRRCSSRATPRRSSRRSTPATTSSSATRPVSGTPPRRATPSSRLYTQNSGKIDGVVSANDTMAGGIIARLKANGLAGKVPVTGQDASVEGLQAILAGNQCMTVYKNTNLEADAASKLAIALIKGDKAAADALANGHGQGHRTEQGRPVRAGHARGDLQGQRQGASSTTASRRPRTSAPATYAELCTAGRHQLMPCTGARSARAGPPLRRARRRHDRELPLRAEEVSAMTRRPTPRQRRAAGDRQPRCCRLRGINKSFGAVHVLRASTSTSTPARSPRWSATTAPARAP